MTRNGVYWDVAHDVTYCVAPIVQPAGAHCSDPDL